MPFEILTALVAAGGLLALVRVVACYVFQAGPRRAGLAPLASSLALVCRRPQIRSSEALGR